MKFIETAWVQLSSQGSTPSEKTKSYTQKVVKLENVTTHDVHYITKADLVSALGSTDRGSRFVNRKRDHVVHCEWATGPARSPDGQLRQCSWAKVVEDPETGLTLVGCQM